LRAVMATNGTLLTHELAVKTRENGIARVSVSIDGASAESHDSFRGVRGAFEAALRGIEHLKKAGVEFQINSSITGSNVDELPALLDLSHRLGAAAHHIFIVVPTGRAADMKDIAISPARYERLLRWLFEKQRQTQMHIKLTCAPQYYILCRNRSDDGKRGALDATTSGCLGGKSFCFISSTGTVQPCGYLEVNCGNIREKSLDEIWRTSPLFEKLRNLRAYSSRCGRCAFNTVCGGCRARAYAESGDITGEDPYCILARGEKPDLKGEE